MIHRGYQEDLTTICLENFRNYQTNMEFFPQSHFFASVSTTTILYVSSTIVVTYESTYTAIMSIIRQLQ